MNGSLHHQVAKIYEFEIWVCGKDSIPLSIPDLDWERLEELRKVPAILDLYSSALWRVLY